MVAVARARMEWDNSRFRSALDATGQQIDRVNENQLKRFAGQMATAFSVGMVVNWSRRFIMESMRVADEIDNVSRRMDISTGATQALQRVADTAGIQFGQFESAISRVRAEMQRANVGNESAIRNFNALGISIDEVRTMNTEQMFSRIATALANADGDAEVLNATFELIGTRAGPQLQKALEGIGDEGLDNLIQRLKEANLILSDETVAALDQAERAYDEWVTKVTNSVRELVGETAANTIFLKDKIVEAFGGMETATGSAVAEMFTFRAAIENMGGGVGTAARLFNEARDRLNAWRRSSQETEAATDDLSNALDNLADTMEEVNEIDEAALKAFEELARRRAQTERDRLSTHERQAVVLQDIADVEAEINALGEATTDNAQEILALKDRKLVLTKELEAVEKDIERSLRDQQRLLDDIEKARRGFVEEERRYILDQLSGVDRLREQQRFLNQDREEARRALNALDRDAIQNQAEIIRLETVILSLTRQEEAIQRQINDELGKQAEGAEEVVEAWKKLDDTDVRVLVDLRDALRDMNEEEIEAFLASIEQLADGLKGLGEDIDIEWLQSLVNLRDLLRGGISGMQVREYGDAIGDLADALAAIPEPANLGWLGSLINLRNLFRGGISGIQAREYADAIGSLARRLGQIDAPDTQWLQDLVQFTLPSIDADEAEALANALSGIAAAIAGMDRGILSELSNAFANWPASDVSLDLRLPSDSDLTLKVPDSLNDNLPSIARSLETLANLKGVVWA